MGRSSISDPVKIDLLPGFSLPQKPEEIEKEIQALEADLKEIKRELAQSREHGTKGGSGDDSTFAIAEGFLRNISFKVTEARKRLEISKSFYPIGDKREFPNVSYEESSEKGGELTEFNKFKGNFVASVGVWATSVKSSIGDLSQSFKDAKIADEDGQAIIMATVLLSLVKKAGPVGKAVEYGKTVYDALSKNAKFKQKDVKNLTEAMADAFYDTAIKQEILEPAFNSFVDFWKLKNGIPKEQTAIPYNIFQDEAIFFADRNLPSANVVKQSMIIQMFKYLEDDEIIDLDKDGSEAGYIRVDVRCPENPYGIEVWDRGDWEKWVSGCNSFDTDAYLDDVGGDLTQLFKDNFRGFKLLDLPMKIVFKWTLPTGWDNKKDKVMYSNYEFTRENLTPGNTMFFQSDGPVDHFVLNAFHQKRLYSLLGVNSLK